MPIHLIGESAGHAPPFNRAFFSSTIGDIIGKSSQNVPQKLTLFLTDGATLDLCNIEGMNDEYMIVRIFHGHGKACGTIINILPFALIYRVQLTPVGHEDVDRAGFKWISSVENGGQAEEKNTRKKARRSP